MLNSQLHRGVEYEQGVKLAAVFMEHGIPLGVTVVTRTGDIQVFVRKNRRREGIGSKLIEYARNVLPKEDADRMDAGTGLLSGSREFWRANKVRMYD